MLSIRIETHRSSMASVWPIVASRRWVLASVGVLVGSFALAACVAEPPEVTIDDPVLFEGRDVYARNCASCHGADGGGGIGLRLNEGLVVERFPNIEDQIQLVNEGRNNMPSYRDRLTEEQIDAVVRYTREVL